MCGHNMLKIDVKKTLKNGGAKEIVEERAITISHSTGLVVFCLLVFSNCRFFLILLLGFFLNFELTIVIR